MRHDVHPAPPVETPVNLGLGEVRISDYEVQKTNVSISRPTCSLLLFISNDEVVVYNRTEAGQTKILKGHQSYTTQVRWLANGILCFRPGTTIPFDSGMRQRDGNT